MSHPEPSPVKIDPAADSERKNRLMRDMAALRLQAEISQLENSLKNEEFSLPPYLVVDSTVLCQNLNLIQQFVQSQRFIVVIPLVGQWASALLRRSMIFRCFDRCSDRQFGRIEEGTA